MKSLLPKLIVLWIVFSVLGCAAKFEPANPVAFGRNWTLLGVNAQDKSQQFYDPANVTYLGNITRFDIRVVEILGYESLGVAEVDCQKNMVRAFDTVRYDKYFRSVGRQPDSPWLYFRPDSIIGANKSIFCK
jgi:hypothetical protein